MKKRNNLFFLKDIENSVRKILNYTENIDFETFLSDEKTIDAVERNFEIIGEAVKSLTDDFKNTYPAIPFRQIAGMRDKIIHDYFGVDYEIVWKTIKSKLPEFKSNIEKIIKTIEEN